MQLAYAAVTLAVYAAYFAPGFPLWVATHGGTAGEEAAAAEGAKQERQAVQHAVLYPADDRQMPEPLASTALVPVPEPLVVGAGTVEQETAGQEEGPSAKSGSQEDLEGWEVLEQGAAGPAAGQEADEQDTAGQQAIVDGSTGLRDAAAAQATASAPSKGLRRRGIGRAVSTQGPAAEGSAAEACAAGTAAQSPAPAPDVPETEQESRAQVLRLCGHFTLQARTLAELRSACHNQQSSAG
jgi:hypothetical protein